MSKQDGAVKPIEVSLLASVFKSEPISKEVRSLYIHTDLDGS